MTFSDGFIQLSTKQPYLEGMIFSVNIMHAVTCTLQCICACYMNIACPFVRILQCDDSSQDHLLDHIQGKFSG